MTKTFDFFYDLGSPYSYLASTQLAGIEQRTGAKARLLAWGEGWHNNHHAFQRSARHGHAWWELDMTWHTIRALRACIAADLKGKGAEAMHALFHAYWGQGDDISDAPVIERALKKAGLDGKALVARTEDQEIKDCLRKNTDLALARGVFGVPTLFVGERSFWGNDRLQFAEAELRRQG